MATRHHLFTSTPPTSSPITSPPSHLPPPPPEPPEPPPVITMDLVAVAPLLQSFYVLLQSFYGFHSPLHCSSASVSSVVTCFIILSLLLCILKNGCALEGGDFIESRFLTVETSSLLPSSVCDSSTKGPNKRASSLKLVHRHGPCSQQKSNSPTISQILSQDQSRVSLIQSRIALASKTTNTQTESKLTLPGRLGNSIGLDSSNYIVTVGLGTPKKDLSLIFDTGSELTWTQCKPCPECYKQKEPVLDPLGSSSYSNITCGSRECKQLSEYNDCESNTCVYYQGYNDKSSSRGFLAKETLTLTPTDVFKGFVFGCGQHNNDNNDGLFGKTAGLLGLGPEEFSFVSQTNEKYGKMFSYCLPSKSSSTGHLTFGNSGVSSSLKFIPFSRHGKPYYSIDIIAIYVGGTKLSNTSTAYTRGTVIDSGTVITRLPLATYNMLRATFRKMMIKYPRAANLSLLDTCYNLSNYSSIYVPKISFLFNGNVMVDMDQSGILFGDRLSQMCLAFSGSSSNDFSSGIFGNVQQKTLEVVYDVAGGKLGFGAGGCS